MNSACRRSSSARAIPPSARGMTLIEMLVVLTVIGVVASAAVLAIGPTGSANLQAEAKQLEARLQLAADQTMVEDSELALNVASDGYAFVEWDAATGGWQAAGSGPLAEPITLPSAMSLQSSEPANPLPLNAQSSGRGFTLTLTEADRALQIQFDGMTARLAAGPAAS